MPRAMESKSSMAKPRILFVDDEPGIRLTLPAILEQSGFEMTVAANVTEALKLITTEKFSVLISDLNIDSPGDGFTIVSAMRRIQPEATTIILTGYPAFETALEAIRQQVDDYVVKPADIPQLIERITGKLGNPRGHTHVPVRPKRLSELLRELKEQVIEEWFERVNRDESMAAIRLTRSERIDHLGTVFDELIGNAYGEPAASSMTAAAKHGLVRLQQGYTLPMLVREARILQDVIGEFVQRNLLGINLSYVVPDLVRAGGTIEVFLEESIANYLREKPRHSQAAPGDRSSVLLLSGDPDAARLRDYALTHAGFHVVRPNNRQEALQIVKKGKFHAAVVSYTLSSNTVEEMTNLFRESNPQAPIVVVTKGKWADWKTDLDVLVTAEEGPEALIEALQNAINRKKLRLAK